MLCEVNTSYVKGTLNFGILYSKSKELQWCGYSNQDWEVFMDHIKSTIGYVFNLHTRIVSWINKKQHAVSMPSTKAKFRERVRGACGVVWLRRVLSDPQVDQNELTLHFSDNQEVLKLAKNPIIHECTKHVDVHCYLIGQLVEDGVAELKYCPAQDQIANILIKSLGLDKYVRFRDKLGVFSRMTVKGGCWSL